MLRKIKLIASAFLVLILFISSINNYIGNTELTIQADGIGYYDYLPATFIYHDLYRLNTEVNSNTSNRVAKLKGIYVKTENGSLVNKYAVGTALLQMPFFLAVYLTEQAQPETQAGYTLPYQKSVFYAALFYLFLSLIFLHLLLETYAISSWVIFISQLLLVLATSLTHYANVEASFSHVYSLFAITAFLYFARQFFILREANLFLWSSFFFGLILILRPVNILILAALPFIAGSFENIKEGLIYLYRRYAIAGMGVCIVLLFGAFLSLIWYVQCEQFILNTYNNEEGFYFLNPQIWNILFSYKKGLFIYAPILFIAFFTLIIWFKKKQYFTLLTWLGFFIFLTYILSSWWSWFYGCSYGLRAYIDFYALFFIPIAILVQSSTNWLRLGIIVFGLASVYLNLVQTYQYKEYILHWIDMDQTSYWKVFGETDRKYKGILWKRSYDLNTFELSKELPLHFNEKQDKAITFTSSQIPNFEKVSLIEISLQSNFRKASDMLVFVKLKSLADTNYYYEYHVPLIHFIEKAEGEFNTIQTGRYFYEIPFAPEQKPSNIEVIVKDKSELDSLSHMAIKFYYKHS